MAPDIVSREEEVRSRAEVTSPPIRLPHPLCVGGVGAAVGGAERAAAMLSEPLPFVVSVAGGAAGGAAGVPPSKSGMLAIAF